MSGLTLLVSDEGLAIANELVGLGKKDLLMSFLQDPMQMMMDNSETLLTAGSNLFEHMVDLVNKDSNIPLLTTLSNQKIGAPEIATLREVLPMVKDAALEHKHGIKPTPGYPSKTALLTAKVAQLVDQKLVAMGADPTAPEKPLGELVDSFAAQLSKATTMAESLNKSGPVVAAPVSEKYRGTMLGSVLSVKNTASALFQNTVTQPILNKAKGAATMVGAGVVAGKIDKQLAKAGLTAESASSEVSAPKEKPVKQETEKLSLTLDREKVQSFAVSTASMVFRALSENPLMIDSGLSAARSFVSDAVDILSQEATPKERTTALTTLVNDHAETLGTTLRESGNSLAEKVADLISDADTLLSSDIVQRSLRKSKLPTDAVISSIGQKIADKVSDKVTGFADKVTTAGSEAMEKVGAKLDKVGVEKTKGEAKSESAGASKEPKEKKDMTYKVSQDAYDRLGVVSGKVDKPGTAVLRFISGFVQDGG